MYIWGFWQDYTIFWVQYIFGLSFSQKITRVCLIGSGWLHPLQHREEEDRTRGESLVTGSLLEINKWPFELDTLRWARQQFSFLWMWDREVVFNVRVCACVRVYLDERVPCTLSLCCRALLSSAFTEERVCEYMWVCTCCLYEFVTVIIHCWNSQRFWS